MYSPPVAPRRTTIRLDGRVVTLIFLLTGAYPFCGVYQTSCLPVCTDMHWYMDLNDWCIVNHYKHLAADPIRLASALRGHGPYCVSDPKKVMYQQRKGDMTMKPLQDGLDRAVLQLTASWRCEKECLRGPKPVREIAGEDHRKFREPAIHLRTRKAILSVSKPLPSIWTSKCDRKHHTPKKPA